MIPCRLPITNLANFPEARFWTVASLPITHELVSFDGKSDFAVSKHKLVLLHPEDESCHMPFLVVALPG